MPDEPHRPLDPDGNGPDWAGFYAYTRGGLGREPRPLFTKGLAVLEAAGARPGRAIEIGFGDGTETLALLGAGWHVLAVDPTPEAAMGLRSRVHPGDAERLEILTLAAEAADLRPFDLLYAGYALPFVAPDAFVGFWAGVRRRLLPGGHLVFNVFGTRDAWAGDPGMTFLEREAVHGLVDGLEIVAIDEEEGEGDSFVGPKHWHLFDVVARRPPAVGE
jgi:SAM-dependent methyltransferase